MPLQVYAQTTGFFNPKHARTALPYQGERLTITGYSVSGVEKLSLLDRNVLACVKFPIPGLKYEMPKTGPHFLPSSEDQDLLERIGKMGEPKSAQDGARTAPTTPIPEATVGKKAKEEI